MFERPPSFNLEELAIYAGSAGIQISYAVLNVLTSVQLSAGMQPLTFVVYVNLVAVWVLSPFAFFMERKKRPTMSMPIFFQIVLLSIAGVSAFDALTVVGLRDTSSALASAMPNLAPAIIFILAWILGMEKVDIRCNYSRSKIVGTGDKRSFYLAAATVSMCSAMLLQVETLKKYPAVLSLTMMTCLLGSIETAILQIMLDRGIKEASWKMNWSSFGTILYAGVIGCGLSVAVQTWCLKKKGPVFVAIFNPVCAVFAAILSAIFLHEALHLGSAIGVLLIFTGLYFVLWGKSKDSLIDSCKMSCDEEQLMKGDVANGHHCNHIADINKPLLQ